MRLTIADAQTIAEKATAKYMKEPKRLLEEVSTAFGLLVYSKLADQKVFKQVNKLPDEWKFMRENISIRFPFGKNLLRLEIGIPAMPFPPRYNSPELTVEEAIQAKAVYDEEIRIDHEKHSFYGEVLKFVKQFKSFDKLEKAWPEGKEFYARSEPEANRQQLITLPKGINAKLGLK